MLGININAWQKAGIAGLFTLGSSSVYASTMLQSGDFVGYSFWLISMALAASTIFFLWKRCEWAASGQRALRFRHL